MDRDFRRDLLALGVATLSLFLALSLLSHNRHDPVTGILASSSHLVYPIASEPSNWCGPIGASVSYWLYTTLGWGAFFVVASLIVYDAQLWRYRISHAPVFRAVGWYLALLALCTLAELIAPDRRIGGAFGAGGQLGNLGAGVLQLHFYTAGTWILTLALAATGILLCSDYVLFHLAWLVLGAAWARTPAAARWGRRWSRNTNRDSRESDGEASEQGNGKGSTQGQLLAPDGLSVRIGGRRLTDLDAAPSVVGDDDDEAWEDDEEGDEGDYEYEYEEEAEEDDPEYEEVDEAANDLGIDTTEPETAPDADRTESPATAVVSAAKLPPVKRTSRKQRQTDAPSEDRQAVIEQLDEAVLNHDDATDYELPSLDLLLESEDISFEQQAREVRRKAKTLEKTFKDFGFNVKVVEIETGPVIAQYEVELEAGLRLSKITGLADDLAIALRAPSVRIVAPIPGKNTVGIEVPNEQRQLVRLREVLEDTNGRVKKMYIPIFLGKDVAGNSLTADLASLPHLLIAGRTGTGKSVCLNSIISSILMTRRPDEVRMIMIDPKMVELSGYRTLPHLMHPVVTDMRKAEAILAWAVDKMEERYELLARAGVRHVSGYNQLGRDELKDRLQEDDDGIDQVPHHLPFIVIVADEMADLMMTSGKEVESHIIRLAQKSRAVGIHLILATQKPTVDVITGLIKSNLPARICFQVASRTDSRVVLDEMGAEKLLGNGDMLFLWPGTSTLLRGQGTYMSDDEINRIVDAVSTGEQDFVRELVHMKVTTEEEETQSGRFRQRDELYEQAVDVVVREGRGSVSLLQRALGVGYGRGARLIDFMAEDGIVGPYNGTKSREVTMTVEQWEQMQRGEDWEEDEPSENRTDGKRILTLPSAATVTAQDSDEDAWEEDEYLEDSPEGSVEEADEDEVDEADDNTGDDYADDEYAEDDYDGEEYEYEYEEYEEEDEEDPQEAESERIGDDVTSVAEENLEDEYDESEYGDDTEEDDYDSYQADSA